MKTADLKVNCSRAAWLVSTVLVFVLLGQWRCLVINQNVSLFDILADVPQGFHDMTLKSAARDMITMVPVAFLAAVYLATSAALAWVPAAVFSIAVALLRRRVRPEHAGETDR